ncbi:MAG: hypothetical protein ABI193_07165, partial [Minicystis sp.]
APNGSVRPQLPLEKCTGALVTDIDQYVDTDGGAAAVVPHLYALVTQTTRGEVAVIDTTAINKSVLDEDPAIPGATFLPIGAQPIDIVSTPGGTATFVGVAEVGREAIFALPSSQIRPASSEGSGGAGGGSGTTHPPPKISSWPACRLPFAPGPMMLLNDAPNEKGGVRVSCDSPTYSTTADGDPTLDLGIEGQGRQKLVVTIPDAGGLAVIDAQALLDRAPGSFDPCPVERWLPLRTDTPVIPPAPPASGEACVNLEVEGLAGTPAVTSRPSGLSYAAGRLYVSDLDVPLIHVIDLPTPCAPVEIDPLLPTSLEDPTRIVTTTRVAVAPSLTPALKRYLYAIDAGDGSAMVFDVSDETLTKLPLQRSGHPEWDPFEPPDRIRYSAPAADLLIVQRDIPVTDPATGAAVEGVRCDPSPTLSARCNDPTAQSCDVSTAYRTSSTYDSGAGPRKLRGTFAMLALTSGRVAVVDIDDYDAPCRAPAAYSPLFGCKAPDAKPPELVSNVCSSGADCKGAGAYDAYCSSTLPTEQGFCTYQCGSKSSIGSTVCPGTSICTDAIAGFCALDTSREVSCNMVLPNAPRAGLYAATEFASGQHVPGLSIFPLLYDDTGTLIASDEASARMVATLPDPSTAAPLALSVGGTSHPISSTDGTLTEDKDLTTNFHHDLLMNAEDPRAQLVDQGWFVTFEGTIPGFDQKVATLFPAKGKITELRDPNSRFCDAGTHSENEVLFAQGKPKSDAATKLLADYVQITASLVADDADYWKHPELACTFQECLGTFGDSDSLQGTRDLRIVEAYQDHVEVTTRDEGLFFKVNAKGQYIDADGNVIVDDPATMDGDKRVPATAAEIGDLTHCCFPGQVNFSVRLGNQWTVRGDASGFLHHVIADPATGACRDSCDPRLARKNGRVTGTARDKDKPKEIVKVHDREAGAFINPMFRFAVQDKASTTPADVASRRDLQFRFTTIGSFTPLLVDLSSDAKTLIAPVGMTYLPSTGDLAVTDGSINGLILVNLSSVAVTRQFF